jgi:glc operon protein GlcG
MTTKAVLTQKVAKHICDLVEQEAIRQNLIVSIAILNDAGVLMQYTKMDGSSNASADICIAKAYHSAYYRRDTKYHEEKLIQGATQVLALPRATPIEGGLLLIYRGEIVGAIGVSGAPSEDDARLAKVGTDYLLTL